MTIRVSTFELLVKPIAPRAPLPIDFVGVARRVIQGYFLTITNLQDVDIRFSFRFLSSAPTPDNLDRRLSRNNVDLLYDIAGNNLSLETILALSPSIFFPNTYLLSGSFILPAQQTATVQLLPRLTSSLLNDPEPDFEVRGFVELSIPLAFRDGQIQAQVDEPVEVLLQPEIRGTFLPNDLDASTDVDFDQINYSLIPANGQALNVIEPAGFTPVSITSEITEEVRRALESNLLPVEILSPENQISQFTQLVANLSQIEPNDENLSQLSRLLADVNIPIAMNRVSS
jgi:hypothetical protein